MTRQNVSGDFGDNQQDFWLTATQRNWSNGQGRQHFKQGDPVAEGQYFLGSMLNAETEGEVTMVNESTALSPGAAVTGAGADTTGATGYTTSSTNLYLVGTGTITSLGAHGAGGVCKAIVSDGDILYLTGSAAGSVRRMALSTGIFSTFQAVPMDDIVFLNNTLYGAKGGTLYSFSTAGVITAQFQFKDAVGTAYTTANIIRMAPFGGKILLIKTAGTMEGCELWIWDGALSVSKLMDFPPEFTPTDICVNTGIAYIAGINAATKKVQVYGYDGSMFLACQGTASTSLMITASCCAFGTGFLVTDGLETTSNQHQVAYFDAVTGGCTPVGHWADSSGGPTGRQSLVSVGPYAFWLADGDTTVRTFGWNVGSAPAESFVIFSQFDFDSSLQKLMRGVTVDFFKGGSSQVDVYYTLDDGAEVLLQANVTSGTEVRFSSSVIGKRVEIRLVMKSASGATPIIRRLYVRASPIQSRFRTGEYVVDMSGRDGKTPVQLRNGLSHPLDGQAMVTQFLASATSTSPVLISDRLGSFTGIVDLTNMDVIEIRPEEYMVHFTVKEV